MDVPESLLAPLNDCKYLYLRNLEEPRDNQLRLLIEEAGTTGEAGGDDGLASTYSSIESTDESRLFEITFNVYIAYSVRNESFTERDDFEEMEFGQLAVVYKKSRFLDYVAVGTFATAEYPGPFRHFGFNCLNHTIDVASMQLPIIRSIPLDQKDALFASLPRYASWSSE